MRYLVKGLCEIHYDHVGLFMITIQCTIQIANQIMEELNQLGFAGPLTSETMLPLLIKNVSVWIQVPNWKGVHKLLKNLKTHKATGPDSIPAFTLNAAAEELAPALDVLFQFSLDQGEIPTDWKEALVVPIFKKGDKHQASNYMPVSLSSITCKLLEHIIHSSIMKHFDQHKILNDNQHGFRKKRSCETQLLSTIQKLSHQQPKENKLMSSCWTSRKPSTK